MIYGRVWVPSIHAPLTMFLKIPRTDTYEWGDVAFRYLDVDHDGSVLRVVDVDSQNRVISRSPTAKDRYSALDHPPLADSESWREFEIPTSEFEDVWGTLHD
jgi:hypothetical protein